MIPILFDSTETAFTSQGIGRLLDARRCEVTEERNGIYELVLEYPTSGPLFNDLTPGKYIYATHDDHGDLQAFEIYKTSAPLDGWMTVNAWHISYKLNTIVVQPFAASTCAAALAGIPTNSINTNPFTFWTDKSVTAAFALNTPEAARAVLGGVQGSILDVYGAGEYEFDMFTVKLHAHRGSNNGVMIRYGKNLRALDYMLDASNRFNAVVPFWDDGSTSVYSTNLIVKTGQTADRAIPLDLTMEFETQPTVAQLEAAAQAYIDGSANYAIKDNLVINMVPIWQTEEFKDFADIERVKLCDTVTVVYGNWGINATAKVIKVVYNTLLDRYTTIELGEPKTTLSQQIAEDLAGNIKTEAQGAAIRAVDNLPDASTTERGLVQFPITLAQGGTGGTTQAEAWANLVMRPSYTWALSSGVASSFNIPNNSRHLVVVVGSNPVRDGLFLLRASSTGVTQVTDVHKGSSISYTTTTNNFTITAAGGQATIMFMTLSGSMVTKNE